MLYYCKVRHGNFGDDLNPWLWPRLAPEVCAEDNPALFLGIGTILSYRIPVEPVKVVFGSGWADSRPPRMDQKWFVYCVRGPLTAARLGLDPSLAGVDPAVLVRRIPAAAEKKCHPVSFMPHHWSTRHADWASLSARVGIHCIDPRSGVDRILSELQQTELLLAEAMHGAIVADALRVPWIPVRIYAGFQEFKWQDWAQSVRVPVNLASVRPVFQRVPVWRKRGVHAIKSALGRASLGREDWTRLGYRLSSESEISDALRALEKVPSQYPPCLSGDKTMQAVETRLFDKLGELRAAWRAGRFSGA